MKCQRCGPEIRRMWQRIRLDCGWSGAPTVRRLFGDERATPAVLEFLEDTMVGKMPGHILMAGGPDLEEELGVFLCRPKGRRRKGLGLARAKKRMGQALPFRMYFSFIFLLFGG